MGSHEVIEILLRADAAAHPENMGRCAARIEFDVVSRAVPQVARVGQKIMDLIGVMGLEP